MFDTQLLTDLYCTTKKVQVCTRGLRYLRNVKKLLHAGICCFCSIVEMQSWRRLEFQSLEVRVCWCLRQFIIAGDPSIFCAILPLGICTLNWFWVIGGPPVTGTPVVSRTEMTKWNFQHPDSPFLREECTAHRSCKYSPGK